MKAFLIDTNVILDDPQCIFNFEDNVVIIAMSVIEELDKIKNKNTDIGQSARIFSRNLDALIFNNGRHIRGKIKINDIGGKLILMNDNEYVNKTTDDKLLALAKKIKSRKNYTQVTLITNDINLKIKAYALGVHVETYRNNIVNANFESYQTYQVDSDDIDRLYAGETISILNIPENIGNYCLITNEHQKKAPCRVIDSHDDYKILQKVDLKDCAVGVRAKNLEQKFFLNALMDPDIDMVVCNGYAGTGKTLLSIAAGLECIDRKRYDKMMIYKSIIPFGRDIGYLKGDLHEKIRPWLSPFYDNLDYIFEHNPNKSYQELINLGIIEIDALTYIRGRTLPNRFIIIDEVQNLTQKQIKTIVTRIGYGSKLVLIGDIHQIDNSYLNKYNNALSYVMYKMSGLKNVAIMNMYKAERSFIAEQALEKL